MLFLHIYQRLCDFVFLIRKLNLEAIFSFFYSFAQKYKCVEVTAFIEMLCLSFLLQAQQLTELEQKLAVAKNELEKAALDRVSPHPGAIATLVSVTQGMLTATCDYPLKFLDLLPKSCV
jgi:hypothetical protein